MIHSPTIPFPRTLSTLWWPKRPAWMSRVEVLNRASLSSLSLLGRLATAAGYDAVAIDGATGGRVRLTDLGAAILLARRREGPAVIVTDATWSRGRGRVERAARGVAFRAIDSPRVVYCVLSSDEQRIFPLTWSVDPARVVFTPFYFTLSGEALDAPTSEDLGVFAGGDSLRDYEPLLRAARCLPAPVILATKLLDGRRDLPANVKAGWVPQARFVELMRAASVVVVALAQRTDRSAGQQTYLNAMALGKLVIVPDVMGVRDYVAHQKTGLVVPPGDADALAAALRWALDPANRPEVKRMAARAREDVRARFTPERYVQRIIGVIEGAYARDGASSGAR